MVGFWNGKKVLVTGHTGFKGSWLCLWLQKLGAEVVGYALKPPTEPNLFTLAKVTDNMVSLEGDIRDKDRIQKILKATQPEIVLHLAAQPLVRKSYLDPVETMSVNVLGTATLLNEIRFSENTRAVVNITSDKCYENREWVLGYRESDPMGGIDPYSCSKGCSELVTSSFRKSFYNGLQKHLASARAGNVIGGGDWAEDRLVPDTIKALINGHSPQIRNPHAIRPWQHVLEPLQGYLLLAEKLWYEGGNYSEAWNFGPSPESEITVAEFVGKLIEIWGGKNQFTVVPGEKPQEAGILKLDCSKAKERLGWNPRLGTNETLNWTAAWYQSYFDGGNARDMTFKQIEEYEKMGCGVE